jgi:Protein of unknown function (DUF2752)
MKGAAVAAPPRLKRPSGGLVFQALLAFGGLATLIVLFAVNPARHQIYPECWLYATTGLQCPGCGGLRATHQLLHGQLAAAWALNPLAVLVAPLLGWFGVDSWLKLAGHRGLSRSAPRPFLIWLALAVVLLFGVVRNLPWY